MNVKKSSISKSLNNSEMQKDVTETISRVIEKKRTSPFTISKIAIIVLIIIVAIIADIVAQYFSLKNIPSYIGLSISIINLFLFYELCTSLNKEPRKNAEKLHTFSAFDFERSISILKQSKDYIINEYTEKLQCGRTRRDSLDELILTDPSLLKSISTLRVSLYELAMQIELSHEENKRFEMVLSSLRNFSEKNISEVIDNLDFLSAIFTIYARRMS